MKVEQILESKGTDVYAVGENDAIADAVAMLNDKNIGAVVVRGADDKIAGILSERDVVRRLGDKGEAALSLKVKDCMTRDPITCSPDASINDLMAQMTEKRVRHLPVAVDGKLLGVVSIGDVVKRKIEQAEKEAEALKDYIAG